MEEKNNDNVVVKNNNASKITIICVIIGILLILGGLFVHFYSRDKVVTDENKFIIGNEIKLNKLVDDSSINILLKKEYDTDKYFYNFDDRGSTRIIKFYDKKDDNIYLVGKYNCSSKNCFFEGLPEKDFFEKGVYPIYDSVDENNGFLFLYDVENNIISDKYSKKSPNTFVIGDRYVIKHSQNFYDDDKELELLLDDKFNVLASYDILGKTKMAVANFFNFNDDVISVYDGKKDGIISLKDGKLIVPCKYDQIVIEKNKNIVGVLDKKMEFISNDGKVISNKYDYLYDYGNGYYLVLDDGYGVILDKDFKAVSEKIKPLFDNICGYNCDYMNNPINTELDENGNIVLNLSSASEPGPGLYVKRYIFDVKTHKLSVIDLSSGDNHNPDKEEDKDDKFVLGNGIQYNKLITDQDVLKSLKKFYYDDSFYYFFDDKNNTRTIKLYDKKDNKTYLRGEYKCLSKNCDFEGKASPEFFKNKVIPIVDWVDDENYIVFLYDINANKISNKYKEGNPYIHFIGNRYIVKFNTGDNANKKADLLLDDQFNVLVSYRRMGRTKFSVENLYNFNNTTIEVFDGNKYGAISLKDGKLIIPFKYDRVAMSDKNSIAILDKKMELINSDGKVLSDKYDYIYDYNNGYYFVINDGYGWVADNNFKIISKKIKILFNDICGYNCDYTANPVLTYIDEDGIIHIDLYKNNNLDSCAKTYLFNLKTKTLSEEKR